MKCLVSGWDISRFYYVASAFLGERKLKNDGADNGLWSESTYKKFRRETFKSMLASRELKMVNDLNS